MTMFPTDRSLRTALWVILLTALAMRLAAACGLQYLLDNYWHRTFLIPGDADGYWELARNIVAGKDFAIHTPPRYVLRMPGFPVVLAIPISLFGESLFAARLWLAIIGSSACWFVFDLGRRLFDDRTGVIAAAFTAICPTFVIFSVIMLSETCFAITLLWSLAAGQSLYAAIQRPVDSATTPGRRILSILWPAIFTGLAIAAGTYMRPSWIAAALVFVVLLIYCTQRRLLAASAGLIVVASMVLALLPWGLRNRAVTGHFTLTTFWMGPSLYDGLRPDATGDSDMRFFDQDQLPLTMSEFEVDQEYRKRAFAFARENPRRTAELALVKLWRYLKPWPNAAEFGSWWISLAIAGFYLPAILLAGYGIWTGRGSIWTVLILVGPILYFAALHMLFVSSLRYRLPAEYPLLILSAVGLQEVWNRRRGTRI